MTLGQVEHANYASSSLDTVANRRIEFCYSICVNFHLCNKRIKLDFDRERNVRFFVSLNKLRPSSTLSTPQQRVQYFNDLKLQRRIGLVFQIFLNHHIYYRCNQKENLYFKKVKKTVSKMLSRISNFKICNCTLYIFTIFLRFSYPISNMLRK